MHLFTDYLQPLTIWLNANPNWALLFTFLISFSESLAIIGSIIPGSVTMTAVGILAGSGVMRIDLTLLAAILGAIAGDGVSYVLGYTFRNSLANIWPFRYYPRWLNYGKDYFASHGGKSVLIGRFVGPLRSIIPMIAGMMHMNRWHFFLANIISAIGWSILYLIPGILIGAASSELSAESATRLFIFILVFLAIIWMASIGLKWLFIRVNNWLHTNLHDFWLWSKEHPRLAVFFNLLTPKHESNHYSTVALLVLFITSILISTGITLLVIQGSWAEAINYPVYLFLQSVRTKSFDDFFIVINLFTQPVSIMALVLSITIYAIYFRDWRTLFSWLSLFISTTAIVYLLALTIDIPETDDLIKYNIESFYPAIDLTFATSLFGFLIFYISTRYRTVFTLTIRVILLGLLCLEGVATVYLGDNWLTSVLGAYFIGLMICIAHWILFRRVTNMKPRSQLPIIFSCLVLVAAAGFSYFLYFKTLVHVHRVAPEQFTLADDAWWNQTQPILPLYTMNRIGQRKGLLNIQYVGSMDKLQQALLNYGWKKRSSSFFYTLLLRIGGDSAAKDLPLTAQLYLNRRPSLTMTYSSVGNDPSFLLRLWRSNYHLINQQETIWVGSVHAAIHAKPASLQIDPFKHIHQALQGYKFNNVNLLNKDMQPLPQELPPMLLLIKAPKP